jgi:translocator protein
MNIFKNISWNINNICRLIVPLILGFSFNFIPHCKMSSDSGSVVKFRPPGVVFGIVWPILYILFGLSWVYTYKNIAISNGKILTDIFYGIITVLLTSWIIVYSCFNNKIGAVYVLFLCIAFTILAMNISPLEARLMLTPLLTWIILASLLNTFEVQNM